MFSKRKRKRKEKIIRVSNDFILLAEKRNERINYITVDSPISTRRLLFLSNATTLERDKNKKANKYV